MRSRPIVGRPLGPTENRGWAFFLDGSESPRRTDRARVATASRPSGGRAHSLASTIPAYGQPVYPLSALFSREEAAVSGVPETGS